MAKIDVDDGDLTPNGSPESLLNGNHRRELELSLSTETLGPYDVAFANTPSITIPAKYGYNPRSRL